MPISMDHAFGRGMVSPKARARALTRMKGSASMGPAGKMTKFDRREKDEAGADGNAGKVGVPNTSKNEINKASQQKLGRWKPSSGGQAKGSYQPKRDAIDSAPNQGRKFPGGATVKRGNLRYRTRGNSGGSDTNGPANQKGRYYGGGNDNRYG